MLKAVIFDMDGVLIDSEPLHAKAAIMTMKKYGVDISWDYCYEFIGTTTRYMYDTTSRLYHPDASVEELIRTDAEMKRSLIQTEGYLPVPHVSKLVRDIHEAGFMTAVASSSTMEEIRTNVTNLGIAGYFDLLVSGTEVPHPKPAPDVFLLTASKLGVSPADTLIIEDSEAGVQAACTAGAACVGFANPNSGSQNLSRVSMIVEGFEEVTPQFLNNVWERFAGKPLTIMRTDRLTIRELSMDYFDDLYRLKQIPDISASLTYPLSGKLIEREKLRAYIDTVYPFYGYGCFGVFLNTTGELIGCCGLEPTADGCGQTELEYFIAPEHRNQGYGYECTSAVLSIAAKQFGLEQVGARIKRNNHASIHLIRKLGFIQTVEDNTIMQFEIKLTSVLSQARL